MMPDMLIAVSLLSAALAHEAAASLLAKTDVAAMVSTADGTPPAVTIERALKGSRPGERLPIAGWDAAPAAGARRFLVLLARDKSGGGLRPIDAKEGVLPSPSDEQIDAFAWPATFLVSFGWLDPRTEIDRALNLKVRVKNVGTEASLFDPARLRGRLFPGRKPALADVPLRGDAVQIFPGETKEITVDLHEAFGAALEDPNDFRLEVRGPGPDELQKASELKFNRESVGSSGAN